jgi:hypothetical protein
MNIQMNELHGIGIHDTLCMQDTISQPTSFDKRVFGKFLTSTKYNNSFTLFNHRSTFSHHVEINKKLNYIFFLSNKKDKLVRQPYLF